MRLLALVRHGETPWNAEYRLQGQIDIGLSNEGRAQAASLAPAVQALRPTRVLSSDLARARETAQRLGFADPELSPAWREADLGQWSGRTKADLIRESADAYQAWRDGRCDPPGAESWAAFRERIAVALRALAGSDGATVVITHGGVIRAACSILVGLEPDRISPVDPGSLTLFDLTGPARLKAFNVTRPMNPQDAPD